MESTSSDHDTTASQGVANESVVGESDNRPKVDTDVTGDRNIPEDADVTGEEGDAGERTD